MSRHHNRAMLIAIEQQNLDPKKKYVVGKDGNLIDSESSASSATEQQLVENSTDEKVVLQQVEESTSVEDQSAVEPVVEKQNKFKKKSKQSKVVDGQS